MDFNYSEGLLLSDLLCLYYKTNEIKYLEELKLRMMFCGYSRNDGRYYEGGHGENISEETKKDSGRAFKKMRGE